jgi:hypothetical protein
MPVYVMNVGAPTLAHKYKNNELDMRQKQAKNNIHNSSQTKRIRNFSKQKSNRSQENEMKLVARILLACSLLFGLRAPTFNAGSRSTICYCIVSASHN